MDWWDGQDLQRAGHVLSSLYAQVLSCAPQNITAIRHHLLGGS